jgi:hypothetical protein
MITIFARLRAAILLWLKGTSARELSGKERERALALFR